MARGEYMVKSVVDCLHCHSESDFSSYGFPPKPETLGGGGNCFNKENVGFPGQVCGQNITPDLETGIGSWTDGEILRAIREGVSRDGRALMTMMPWDAFAGMKPEDLGAVYDYLKTLPPIDNAVERRTPSQLSQR